MLVATFGPSTAWQGREIIWDVDHFILVGHGSIPAAGVLDYDRRGQLVWADPGLRSWAYEVDLWENGGHSSLGPATRTAAAAAGGSAGGQFAAAGSAPAAARRGVPGWVIVVGVVAALALIAAVVLVAVLPSLISTTTENLAQDLLVRANAYALQAGVEAYAAEHGGRFPAAGELEPVKMNPYISVWPQNPYTEQPMTDGGGAGNFRYDVSADGGVYKIICYGGDGSVVIELSGGDQDTV